AVAASGALLVHRFAGRRRDHEARDGNTRRVAFGTPRALESGERADATERRARRAAPEAAMGSNRKELPLRDRCRPCNDEGAFKERSQLLVYHFMFGPDYAAGCPSCSFIADGFNGFAVHLAHHDVMLWAVSRAPLAKLAAYKRRMGWTFPWASSFGSDFNADFNVWFTEAQQREGIEYNYRREPPFSVQPGAAVDPSDGAAQLAVVTGTDVATYTRERPGLSAVVLEEGVAYHTSSRYARGLDGLWGMYQWLDRAPKGRNELGVWWRRHDEYDAR